MDDTGSAWSLRNLRGTPLVVLVILVLATVGIVGMNLGFRGHVQL